MKAAQSREGALGVQFEKVAIGPFGGDFGLVGLDQPSFGNDFELEGGYLGVEERQDFPDLLLLLSELGRVFAH